MTRGRPTDYTPEMLKKAWAYAMGGWKDVGDPVPTVAGLACEIGVSRRVCYLWAEDESKEFMHILDEIAQAQERQLVKGGLLGEYNAPITKMMLTKHGYSDKVETDVTSSDGSMTPKDTSDAVLEALRAKHGPDTD